MMTHTTQEPPATEKVAVPVFPHPRSFQIAYETSQRTSIDVDMLKKRIATLETMIEQQETARDVETLRNRQELSVAQSANSAMVHAILTRELGAIDKFLWTLFGVCALNFIGLAAVIGGKF